MDGPVILVCVLRARPEADRWVTSWQVRYHSKAIRFEGFYGGDLLPPPTLASHEWKMALRFQSQTQAEAWLASKEHAWLVEEGEQLLAEGAVLRESIHHEEEDGGPAAMVTEVIRSHVWPAMEGEYREWCQKINHVQSRFKGYRGVQVLPPTEPERDPWTTLLRFDSVTNLEQWLKSPQRAELLKEAETVIAKTESTRWKSSFPGWVPVDGETGMGPPNWKTALLVLVGLFPVVMLQLRLMMPLLGGLNPSLATFLGNVASVAATTFVTMPLLVRVFRGWLFPKPGLERVERLRGLATVLGLCALEVVIFWWWLPRN